MKDRHLRYQDIMFDITHFKDRFDHLCPGERCTALVPGAPLSLRDVKFICKPNDASVHSLYVPSNIDLGYHHYICLE